MRRPYQDLASAQRVGSHWALDSELSTAAITHKTLWGLTTVKGQFADITGGGEVLEGGAIRGWLTIAANSLDTGHATRDKHLRSADFFDVDRFPSITVRVLSGTPRTNQSVELTAELVVRGVQAPLTLLAQVTETAPDVVAFDVDTTIERERFGLSWNRLGMLTGHTGVSVHAVFTRQA